METSYRDKPYYFVPLNEKADRRTSFNKQKMLAPNMLAGKLNITIECATPLHVGSGRLIFYESTETFTHSLLRENGRITVPGSSFKGMLRSMFEAVTTSCVLFAPRTLPTKVGMLGACNNSSGLCPACSVFGKLSYKGKLIFSSFYTEANSVLYRLPPLEQPFKTYPLPAIPNKTDPRTGNERLYYGNFHDIRALDVAKMSKVEFLQKKRNEPRSGGQFYGRKFYKHSGTWEMLSKQAGEESYECIPSGSTLTGSIIYQGLYADELGAILFALGLGWTPPIYHKLGYAKPAYMGSVKLSVTPAELSPRYGGNHLTTAAATDMAMRHYKKNELLIKPAVDALKQESSEIGDSMWKKQDNKYGY